MLNCRPCMWRCIRALDTSASPPLRLRRDAPASLFQSQQRLFSHATQQRERQRQQALTEVEKLAHSKNEPWKRSAQAAAQNKKARSVLKERPQDRRSREPVALNRWYGRRDPTMSQQDWDRRIKELQYLADPLELATFVKAQLGKDKVTESLQLVRMASHSMQCIVSWNHIIDYQLAKGKTAQAFKIYNEMKKRAQFPDSHTYTIILRGLAINAHESGALAKALTTYHSMSAPNSKVEPSIIHTNAVLKVCARALDMDALWSIAAKIPESGPGAANARTFLTILNAIRQSLIVNLPRDLSEDELAARREKGIVEGRRIWEDIITKWRNADLVIDEFLVNAMGRLLLVGIRPRDWDDVLSLVEQTMDIPRLVPRLGSPAREAAGVARLRAPHVPPEYKFDDSHLNPIKSPMRGDEFLPVPPQGIGGGVTASLTYATPANATLSMVLEASQKLAATDAAIGYWNLLTDQTTYNVKPDINNLNAYLRVLRQQRASGETARLIVEYLGGRGLKPTTHLDTNTTISPGTFRIAMSTCVRDKNNHNSLKNAGQILQAMTSTLKDADAKTIFRYADLARSFPLAKGEDLIQALNELDPIIKNIKTQLLIGTEKKASGRPLNGESRKDAIDALAATYGVFDRLIMSNLIPEEQKKGYKEERARLSALIHRVNANRPGTRSTRVATNAQEGAEDGKVVEIKDGGKEEQDRPQDLRRPKAEPREKKSWFSA
ncbi:hypothetical protein BS50DRAFT_573599 [Corynespora cassiicola Philippines]|uniref:Pentatricopeptide repeat protein-like protein n=1 Tax=Corynespora cassiicola Philippines TaxID=1448308 RepID=A0A2T2NMY8_CORCC|nr:hypothetical protein BS50DRAFT_573599 [Corynespora cassiicola Philippines]